MRARIRAHHAVGETAVVGNARALTRFPAVHGPVAPGVRARCVPERPARPPLHRTAASPPRLPVPERRHAFRSASRTSRLPAQGLQRGQGAQAVRAPQTAQVVPRFVRAGRPTGIVERIDNSRPESVSGSSTCPSRLTPLPEPARSSRERNPSPRVRHFLSLAARADSIADAQWRARLRFVPNRK